MILIRYDMEIIEYKFIILNSNGLNTNWEVGYLRVFLYYTSMIFFKLYYNIVGNLSFKRDEI